MVRNWFPITLAILWIAMAAMAMVDFANFASTTTRAKVVVQQEKPLHSSRTVAKTLVRAGNPRSLPN